MNSNQEIKIVQMEESMIPTVSKIASLTLGSSFVNEEILNNDINLCAKSDTKIVGFVTTKFIKKEYLKKILKNKKLELLEECSTLGYIDTLAVDKNYARKGIGALLLKNTILKLKENNINYAIMAAWKDGLEVNIKALAQKEGFKEEFEIEHFWKEDSIENNFDCTRCGKPPCLCSAIIYTKKLSF